MIVNLMVETEQWRCPFNDLHWIHHLILLYNRKIKKSIRCIFLMNNTMSIMIFFFSSDSNPNLMNLVYYSHSSPSKTTRTRVLKPHKSFKAWESIISSNVDGGIMEKKKRKKKTNVFVLSSFICWNLFL